MAEYHYVLPPHPGDLKDKISYKKSKRKNIFIPKDELHQQNVVDDLINYIIIFAKTIMFEEQQKIILEGRIYSKPSNTRYNMTSLKYCGGTFKIVESESLEHFSVLMHVTRVI